LTDRYCSKCGRKVIENGIDISFWLRGEKGKYTCVFCKLKIEPNSNEAISKLGRQGAAYPISKEIDVAHFESDGIEVSAGTIWSILSLTGIADSIFD